MSQPLRNLSMLLGTIWSEVLLVAGLALALAPPIGADRLLPAMTLWSAGSFVAMWLVIDRLVPDARPSVVRSLKLANAAVFWVCGSIWVYSIATGQPLTIGLAQ